MTIYLGFHDSIKIYISSKKQGFLVGDLFYQLLKRYGIYLGKDERTDMKFSVIMTIVLFGALSFALASETVKGGCEKGYYYSAKVHKCIKYKKDGSDHVISQGVKKEKELHKDSTKGKKDKK